MVGQVMNENNNYEDSYNTGGACMISVCAKTPGSQSSWGKQAEHGKATWNRDTIPPSTTVSSCEPITIHPSIHLRGQEHRRSGDDEVVGLLTGWRGWVLSIEQIRVEKRASPVKSMAEKSRKNRQKLSRLTHSPRYSRSHVLLPKSAQCESRPLLLY